jgi:dTDP-4-amino-4,6-dideoxygalactose transaminase
MTGAHAVRRWLTEHYGDGDVELADRASGLLHAYLVALDRPGTAVIVPSTTCHAVAHAVDLAGYRPVFADVSPDDWTMTTSGLAAACTASPVPVTAAVAVHAFGHLADMTGLAEFCRQHGIALVEDACQVMGSGGEGRHGDAVLVSFGHTKPIDVGAGGALLIRDPSQAARTSEAVAAQSAIPPARAHDATEFARAYYDIRNRARETPHVRSEVTTLAHRYPGLSVHGFGNVDWDAVAALLPGLGQEVARRRQRAEFLRTRLSSTPIILPVMRPGSSPWRFTFLVPDPAVRDHLVDRLRAEVRHASTWYPSLAGDYGQERPTPVADHVEATVVNLWLAEGVDDEYLDRASAVIRAADLS